MKAKKIKHFVRKLEKNCPTCSSVYTLLETHLADKELINCPSNCKKIWKELLFKYCQEKVLGGELEQDKNKNEYEYEEE